MASLRNLVIALRRNARDATRLLPLLASQAREPDTPHAAEALGLSCHPSGYWLSRSTVAPRRELEPHASADLVGVNSLAGGPDQLFTRTVLDLGGTLEVVVPAEQYRDGLDPMSSPATTNCWPRRSMSSGCPFVESTEQAHLRRGKQWSIAASAWWRCGTASPPVASAETADIVSYARQKGVSVAVMWPEGATRK